MPSDRTFWTTISLKKETKNRLSDLGGKGETYEEILTRLLEERAKLNYILKNRR